MSLRLELNAGDVTKLPTGRPTSATAPERRFSIQIVGTQGYMLDFDGSRALVQMDSIQDLLLKVAQYTSVDWKFSHDPALQSTFRPLNRILDAIDSTPSYQIFLAGFHIADSIGFFDTTHVQTEAIQNSFIYLLGILRWKFGKKGRLFILPDDFVAEQQQRTELITNGKLFSATLWAITGEHTSFIEEKLIVPYATPIGFNTIISPETEEIWRRINHLVSRQ